MSQLASCLRHTRHCFIPGVCRTAPPFWSTLQRRWQTTALAKGAKLASEGKIDPRHMSDTAYWKLTPEKLTDSTKASIQQDRIELGLSEVSDWEAFAKDAVWIRSQSGGFFVGRDDPRLFRRQRRDSKYHKKPAQMAFPKPGEDKAIRLEDHKLRAYFSTPVDFSEPITVAEGLHKAGLVKEHDVRYAASKLTWKEKRFPVVTILGVRDHGKTTLTDYLTGGSAIRDEPGSTTQVVSGHNVKLSKFASSPRSRTVVQQDWTRKGSESSADPSSERSIAITDGKDRYLTLLDTPGGKYFERSRLAALAASDVVVLVVSVTETTADDVELRDLVKKIIESDKTIIVALNKLDRFKFKETEAVTRTLDVLRSMGMQFLEDGGVVGWVAISALRGHNIEQLGEKIIFHSASHGAKEPVPSRCEVHVVDVSTAGRHTEVLGVVRCGQLLRYMPLASGVVYGVTQSVTGPDGKCISKASEDLYPLFQSSEFVRRGMKKQRCAVAGSFVRITGFKSPPKPGAILMQLSSEKHCENFYRFMMDVYTAEGNRETYLQRLHREAEGAMYHRKPDYNRPRVTASVAVNLHLRAETFGLLQALLAAFNELPSVSFAHYNLRCTEIGGLCNDNVVDLSDPNPGMMLVLGHPRDKVTFDFPPWVTVKRCGTLSDAIQALKARLLTFSKKRRIVTRIGKAECVAHRRGLFKVTEGRITVEGGWQVALEKPKHDEDPALFKTRKPSTLRGQDATAEARKKFDMDTDHHAETVACSVTRRLDGRPDVTVMGWEGNITRLLAPDVDDAEKISTGSSTAASLDTNNFVEVRVAEAGQHCVVEADGGYAAVEGDVIEQSSVAFRTATFEEESVEMTPATVPTYVPSDEVKKYDSRWRMKKDRPRTQSELAAQRQAASVNKGGEDAKTHDRPAVGGVGSQHQETLSRIDAALERLSFESNL